jgi:hypothetical protein
VIEVEEREGLFRLVGKTMLDADFRGWVLKEPAEAAESIGVRLTEDEVNGIREANPEKVEALAQHLRDLIPPLPMSW